MVINSTGNTGNRSQSHGTTMLAYLIEDNWLQWSLLPVTLASSKIVSFLSRSRSSLLITNKEHCQLSVFRKCQMVSWLMCQYMQQTQTKFNSCSPGVPPDIALSRSVDKLPSQFYWEFIFLFLGCRQIKHKIVSSSWLFSKIMMHRNQKVCPDKKHST